ncbi:hypothetical protein M2651_08605 [Clostridium sp. SYSU_GA19001]|uniref:hypothetical protein n=1 Tax=Clostridium caldaquaticum TaxID=2940653 RepID=UPI002076F44B|nr:hypothetical protein [Clostridium caldaquaticum]MCM8711086.1 hypothetical protein [Clostridium caldaquaticum]
MKKTLNIARGGLFTALGVFLIYLSSIIPTSKLYILGIASAIIPLSILTTSLNTSFVVYTATSLLSLLIIGLKGTVFVYILLLGLYGFIKYYTEKLRNMPVEIILKLLYFNTAAGILYYLYITFFIRELKINISLYAAAIMLQFIFIIFDYALTIFIAYVNKHFVKIS